MVAGMINWLNSIDKLKKALLKVNSSLSSNNYKILKVAPNFDWKDIKFIGEGTKEKKKSSFLSLRKIPRNTLSFSFNQWIGKFLTTVSPSTLLHLHFIFNSVRFAITVNRVYGFLFSILFFFSIFALKFPSRFISALWTC